MNRAWKRIGWVILGVAVGIVIVTQQPLSAEVTSVVSNGNWCAWVP